MATLQLTTDEVSDEPKAHLWMAGRALQCYIGDFFFIGQNPEIRLKIAKNEIFTKCIFVNDIEKTIHMAFGTSKNGSDFAIWRRVQVANKRQFSKRGSSGDRNSAAPVAHLALVQASSSPDSSRGRRK